MRSFHLEFPPAAALCELSLTAANESDDQAGASVGFLSYTYVDLDGTPHEVPLDWADRRCVSRTTESLGSTGSCASTA